MINIIGVIPAAGRATRLGGIVKALTRVAGKHLIEFPLENMRLTGISTVVIIQHDDEISSVLGDTWKDVNLKYVEQVERKGIAHAISLVEETVDKRDMLIIFGDIIYQGVDIVNYTRYFNNQAQGLHCIYGVKRTQDKAEISKSYGLISNGPGKPVSIVEKPQDHDKLLPFLGLGLYVASSNIFDYIKKTKVSELRGEIEFTDTLNLMAQSYRTAGFTLGGYYLNVNTPEELNEAKKVIV